MNDRDDEQGLGSAIASTIEASSPVSALANGIGAFVGGAVAFFAVILATGEVTFSATARLFKEVSHLFYNSLNVPTYTQQTYFTERNGTVVSETVREVWQNGITGWTRVHQETRIGGKLADKATETTVIPVETALPEFAYLLVPIVVLVAVGLVFGYRSLTVGEDTSPRTIAVRSLVGGGILTLGFLLVALVGTYVTSIEATQAFRHPARFETLLYGFAYPAIVGTVSIAVGKYIGWRGSAGSSDGDGDVGASDNPGESVTDSVDDSQKQEATATKDRTEAEGSGNDTPTETDTP